MAVSDLWDTAELDLSAAFAAVEAASPFRRTGRVRQVVGLAVESTGPSARIGEVCSLHAAGGAGDILAEVVGFRDRHVLLLPLGEMDGIEAGSRVVAHGTPLQVGVGPGLLGRVVDAFVARSTATALSLSSVFCPSPAAHRGRSTELA